MIKILNDQHDEVGQPNLVSSMDICIFQVEYIINAECDTI